MISLLLIVKITQLFIIMLIGCIITKLKIVKGEDSLVLSKISLYVLLPSAIINAFNVEVNDDIKRGLLLAFAASLVIHIILFLVDAVYKRITDASSVERGSSIYSNAANLIIPIVSYVLGEEWVIYSCAYMSVQLVFLWTHGISLFDTKKKSIKKILLNVNIIAIAIGLLLMFANVKLPEIIVDAIASLGNMLGPVSMLIAGMLIAKNNLKDIFSNKRTYRVILMRMIVYPLVVLAVMKTALYFMNTPDVKEILLIPYLAAITPTAATVMQFAQVHDVDVELAVSSNIATTLCCLVTMPVMVFLYML
ncbi:MAG: AEC family transporter [Clostridia bacterium]|nr:AEC family transporter [Clostridia bacterium]